MGLVSKVGESAPGVAMSEGKEFAQLFSRFANSYGSGRAFMDAANEMAHDHPTLQSEMFKMCLLYIVKLSEKRQHGHGIDMRNEWATAKADQIVTALGGARDASAFPMIL
jgi:hypothetical protein